MSQLKSLLDQLETYAQAQRRALEDPGTKVSPFGYLTIRANIETMLKVVEETTTLIERNKELEELADKLMDEADEYGGKLREIQTLCNQAL